jgi:hypothetical protein
MSNKSVQNKPMTPMVILSALAKAGVAALAVSSGMPAANARPLIVRNDQVYPLPHFTDAADRANCRAALAAATDQTLAKQQFKMRHTTLTGCSVAVPENGTCNKPIGEKNKNGVAETRLKEPHKKRFDTQTEKMYESAKHLSNALECLAHQSEIEKQGITYKKNPALYKEMLREKTVKIIKEKNLKIDGVSLLLEDGKKGDEICLRSNERRKAYGAAKVAVLLDPKSCKAKGIHPMISGVLCRDVCMDLGKLIKKHKPTEHNDKGGGAK